MNMYKNANAGHENLHVDLEPFKIDTCCEFLLKYRRLKNVNGSTRRTPSSHRQWQAGSNCRGRGHCTTRLKWY
jgi:hypothetical protein